MSVSYRIEDSRGPNGIRAYTVVVTDRQHGIVERFGAQGARLPDYTPVFGSYNEARNFIEGHRRHRVRHHGDADQWASETHTLNS